MFITKSKDMKTAIFYGSSTGTTKEIAGRIAKALGVDEKDVYNVADTSVTKLGDYDELILGSSTWGSGDLQDDWYDFLDGAEALDLSGKKIAVFGVGDDSMSDTFCDAAGEIYDRMQKTGATFVGAFNTFPYEFNKSKAVKVEGAGAVGLLIDETNHPDATDDRIAKWVKEL